MYTLVKSLHSAFPEAVFRQIYFKKNPLELFCENRVSKSGHSISHHFVTLDKEEPITELLQSGIIALWLWKLVKTPVGQACRHLNIEPELTPSTGARFLDPVHTDEGWSENRRSDEEATSIKTPKTPKRCAAFTLRVCNAYINQTAAAEPLKQVVDPFRYDVKIHSGVSVSPKRDNSKTQLSSASVRWLQRSTDTGRLRTDLY